MQNDYNTLIATIKNIIPKGDETIIIMKQCKNDHTKEIEEITNKINKSNELLSKVNYHYEKIKK